MAEEFLKEYAKLIADFPDKIQTKSVPLGDNFVEIIIYADKADTGKLIGKNGKMMNAIKTVISAFKSKDSTSYRVTVKNIDEGCFMKSSLTYIYIEAMPFISFEKGCFNDIIPDYRVYLKENCKIIGPGIPMERNIFIGNEFF